MVCRSRALDFSVTHKNPFSDWRRFADVKRILSVLTDKRPFKMPRNMTGGSGHRSQRNSESNKTKMNNKIGDKMLDDLMDEEKIDGAFVGRVMRRLGDGRMEIFFVVKETVQGKERSVDKLIQAPIRGGMRGRGKKDVWVDVGSVVLFEETGLGGMATHRILSVFTEVQIARYKSIVKDADPRLFLKAASAETDVQDGIDFSEETEVNVDDI
jgi:hypothetical protein